MNSMQSGKEVIINKSMGIFQELDIPQPGAITVPLSVRLFQEPDFSFVSRGEESQITEIHTQILLRNELHQLIVRLLPKEKQKGKDLDQRSLETQTRAEYIQFIEKMIAFLDSDSNNYRILLYLPLELLPLPDKDVLRDEADINTIRLFNKKFFEAWLSLLNESSLRANFVDGDILPYVDKQKRVRKAAHLLPFLLKNYILTEEDILNLIDTIDIADNQELLASLEQGAKVAIGMKVLTSDTYNKIYSKTIMIPSETLIKDNLHTRITNNLTFKGENFNEVIVNSLNVALQIEKKYSLSKSDSVAMQISRDIKRIIWEKGVELRTLIQYSAKQILTLISENKLDIYSLLLEIESSDTNSLRHRIGICAIQLFCDHRTNDPFIEEISLRILKIIKGSWPIADELTRNSYFELLHHLANTNKISYESLPITHYNFPQLEDSRHSVEFFKKQPEITELIELEQVIRKDTLLAEYLFPAFIVVGSLIKGYSLPSSDIDLIVLFKPQTPFSMRQTVLDRLQNILKKYEKVDKIMEFWFDYADNLPSPDAADESRSYTFREMPEGIDSVLGAFDNHFVFNGLWVGEQKIIEKIQKDLTRKYLDLSRFEDSELLRTVFLRQLELDVLQYRLLHKGYSYLFPEDKPLEPPESNCIDWNSNFWDYGYRKLATELFLKGVFLPAVNLNKK